MLPLRKKLENYQEKNQFMLDFLVVQETTQIRATPGQSCPEPAQGLSTYTLLFQLTCAAFTMLCLPATCSFSSSCELHLVWK